MSTTNANQSVYYLYGFNSYSDRRCIKYDTLQEYLALTTIEYDVQAATNFCEGDGVVRGKVTYRKGLGMPKGTPNYAIVADSLGTIQSRWYVVDSLNKNVSTYELVLKRDSVADFYDDVIKAPTFIEKATVNIDSPYIFNDEDMRFNQIKTSETLLKDKTQCPWIVGFMAQKQPEGTQEPFNTTIATNIVGQVDATYNSMSDYPYWNYLGDLGLGVGNKYKCVDDNEGIFFSIVVQRGNTQELVFFNYHYTPNSGVVYDNYSLSSNINVSFYQTAFRITGNWSTNLESNASTIARELISEMDVSYLISSIRDYSFNYGNDIHTQAQKNTFVAENGKLIRTNSGATNTTTGITYSAGVYSINTNFPESAFIYGGISDVDYSACTGNVNTNTALNNFVIGGLEEVAAFGPNVLQKVGNYKTITLGVMGKQYTMEATSSETNSISVTLNENARGLLDAPYRMFCLPYNDNTVKWFLGGTAYVDSNKNINMSIAQAISKQFSGTWLYDLQLVPYCPLLKYDSILSVNSNNEVIIDLTGLSVHVDYETVGQQKSVIFWCQTSQVDNYHINYNIPIASTAEEKKVNNLCDMYRLSSPSYNSMFEFNAEKNGGVSYFDVDLVYKPYDSYIHVCPNFGNLYGDDFNDARGLVFTGPFSLPQTTSAWQQYKMNNMNYQNSFDRQIQHMDTMHDIDMKELKWKVGAGALTGAASGAAMGAMVGGGVGAAVGGVLGAGASLAGGMMDIKNAEKRFDETIDYTKDQFGYNLQNVQAQAQTLSKVSSFTPNNKVFPILEYYTCTGPEKQALRDKMTYNGMTVGVIGTIQGYLQPTESYIKGQVIRLNIDEENHMVEDIKNEIYKGVFIK